MIVLIECVFILSVFATFDARGTYQYTSYADWVLNSFCKYTTSTCTFLYRNLQNELIKFDCIFIWSVVTSWCVKYDMQVGIMYYANQQPKLSIDTYILIYTDLLSVYPTNIQFQFNTKPIIHPHVKSTMHLVCCTYCAWKIPNGFITNKRSRSKLKY